MMISRWKSVVNQIRRTYASCNIRSTSMVVNAGPVHQLEQCCDGITDGKNASV